MARYRKIDTRMWGDCRFRELSSPSPSAKYLWMFLLTGPHTSNIPGLSRGGEMRLKAQPAMTLRLNHYSTLMRQPHCLRFTRKPFSAWPAAEKFQVSKLASFGDFVPPH